MQVHPHQISPAESFDVFYFLRNHTDGATYYVRAVVYDVRSGDVLGTHNLVQAATNPRLFLKTIEAPGDPAGYGRNIVAVATVYTDDTYTTKSENYEEQEAYYLVKNVFPFVGGGGGIDAHTVREIVRDELKTAVDGLPKPEKLQVPDAPDMSFVDGLFGTLGAITREIGRIPKEQADIGPMLRKIEALRAEIESLPRFEKTDLSALAELAQNILGDVQTAANDQRLANGQLIDAVEKALADFAARFETAIAAKIEETIQSQEITLPLAMTVRNPSKKPEAQQNPLDAVRHLTG